MAENVEKLGEIQDQRQGACITGTSWTDHDSEGLWESQFFSLVCVWLAEVPFGCLCPVWLYSVLADIGPFP